MDTTTTPAAAAPAEGTPSTPAAPTTPSIAEVVRAARTELETATAENRDPHWASQPRNPDGTFAGEPTPPAEATPPAAGAAPPAEGAPDAGEGGDPPVPPAGEGEGTRTEEVITPPSEDALKVLLPGRRPGDPEVEFVARTPEEAERLRQLNNGFLRGEEVRAQRREIETIRQAIDTDPVGFLLATDERGQALIPAEVRRDLVMTLLTDRALFQEVLPKLSEWEADEAAARVFATEKENERLRAADDRRRQQEARAPVDRVLDSVAETIQTLIPQGVQNALEWEDEALEDVLVAVQRYKLKPADLTPENVKKILAPRIESAGSLAIPPDPRRASSPPATPPAPTPPAPPAPPAPAVDPEAARNAGTRLVEARQRVEAAAAAAPAGVGASPATLMPPPGQTLKERLTWARQAAGK